MSRTARLAAVYCVLSFVLTLSIASAEDAAPTGEASGELPSLDAPDGRRIRVAVVLAPFATMIDFTGPWEVFQDVQVPRAFQLYTVAASRDPVQVTGGMRILPDHTFEDAPQPDVVVVPALQGSARLHAWLREVSKDTDLTMSVCTGSFQLAQAGLLDGRRATTHHLFLDEFEKRFPDVELVRDVAWVDNGRVATAAGLTSGIDLALHVVARYFGDEVAQRTADYMEHGSSGWRRPERTRSTKGSSGGGGP